MTEDFLSEALEEPFPKAMNTPPSKGGNQITTALRAFRLILGNPLARALLKPMLKKYEINGRELPALYWALSVYAGESINCPLMIRFQADILKLLLKLGIKLARGDEKAVKEALLKDPHIRRGIWVVLEGIAKYGVTVPQKLAGPFLIVWNFTNMCNFRCKHCYQRADRPLSSELTLEEKLMLVDQLDKAGVAAVALSGGEPTIHPHFLRIVKELSSRGIHTSVATNGWVFADKEKLEEAIKAGLKYVEVSVDSAKPEKHDEFRGIPGAWERAVKALENAVELGISHGMAVIMDKDTYQEIDDILDLAENIGVKRVIFFNLVPTGRAEDMVKVDLTPEEREEFMKELYRQMKKRKLEILTTAPQYARVTLLESQGKSVTPAHFYIGENSAVKTLAEFIGGCGAGRIYAGIEPDGTVVPCVFLPLPVGNVRVKPFKEIWENSRIFNLLRNRDNFTGQCKRCPYRNICGGCRARAYHYTLDLLGDDPGCIINRRVWEEIVKHGKPRSLSEVNWVDESIVLRVPILNIPKYYNVVEEVGEKLLSKESQKIHA
ncbi:radical SAM/SPASM domain-containing protein [Pyrococcus furiosus DSM 3638]|uniref:Radical SAM/SPASM domain-containing protein n=3 Tax=Pyrococcus furiosus TaxID=2261 RepID=A0A5C0XQ53_PYRFU|nr:radical SAM/SPASM domain-containing protein [Pyrococcus furiosus]AAL80771.1 heme biosynthesis protein [Pyrococcus furiosus DSM 3638]AFN03437.1 heme biosynthesis protein [Pyrococcus furiosus COM1]QEK78348.1 radical SAM/SPASM domain-containing protein [Pyrococcus furiosus DSM 3638]